MNPSFDQIFRCEESPLLQYYSDALHVNKLTDNLIGLHWAICIHQKLYRLRNRQVIFETISQKVTERVRRQENESLDVCIPGQFW